MSLRVRNAGLLAIACLAAASFAGAADTAVALEQKLRASRPEVLRWQTEPLSVAAGMRRAADIVAIGRVAARTPVRFADGHVAWFAVSGFRPVLVSARTIEARETVGAQDAVLAETDVISIGCDPMVALDATKRWRALRRLTTGAPLCARGLEPAPDVERDQPVTLSARRGAVSVSRVFTAATDAQAGERVRLRDRASGATIVAIVTGPGLARDPDSEEVR